MPPQEASMQGDVNDSTTHDTADRDNCVRSLWQVHSQPEVQSLVQNINTPSTQHGKHLSGPTELHLHSFPDSLLLSSILNTGTKSPCAITSVKDTNDAKDEAASQSPCLSCKEDEHEFRASPFAPFTTIPFHLPVNFNDSASPFSPFTAIPFHQHLPIQGECDSPASLGQPFPNNFADAVLSVTNVTSHPQLTSGGNSASQSVSGFVNYCARVSPVHSRLVSLALGGSFEMKQQQARNQVLTLKTFFLPVLNIFRFPCGRPTKTASCQLEINDHATRPPRTGYA